ncbi:STAS domain-containing protein [Streptomyces sp. NPDC046866]|uniref:STAS domain-containing protein n=1 Tax=Streptomyces sp. NPDC046866 TaxID=3154921 RepID=UPI0034566F28
MKTQILVLTGPDVAVGGADAVCLRLAELYGAGAGAVECDVGALTAPGLAAVETLARLRLTARRWGRGLLVTGAGPELRALLGLVGLVELLGQPEQREPPGGVEEGVEPDDPPA